MVPHWGGRAALCTPGHPGHLALQVSTCLPTDCSPATVCAPAAGSGGPHSLALCLCLKLPASIMRRGAAATAWCWDTLKALCSALQCSLRTVIGLFQPLRHMPAVLFSFSSHPAVRAVPGGGLAGGAADVDEDLEFLLEELSEPMRQAPPEPQVCLGEGRGVFMCLWRR